MAPPATSAAERINVRVDPHNVVVLDQRTSRGPNLIITLLLLAVLLLLIGVATLGGVVQWNPLQLVIPANTATANATVSTTAAPAGSSTVSSSSPAVATPTSLTTVTATAGATATAGGPPVLSVAPTQFSRLVCLGPLGTSEQFQVRNSGSGSLDWTANASVSSYRISPPSGSLARNEQQMVTVSMISLSGQVTITALGATNSPQTVTISCTV